MRVDPVKLIHFLVCQATEFDQKERAVPVAAASSSLCPKCGGARNFVIQNDRGTNLYLLQSMNFFEKNNTLTFFTPFASPKLTNHNP
jgi:hypothetical protein